MKKAFLLALVFISLGIKVNAQTIIPAGDVSGTWSDPVYEIQGDIVIPDGQTLTINPGVKVQFAGNYQLKVLGTILAKGTSIKKITFTSKDTTGFYKLTDDVGGWGGILFHNGGVGNGGCDACMYDNDSSKLDYCVIQYVKNVNGYYGGGITSYLFSKLEISNCEITYNVSKEGGSGIYLFLSSPKVINNNISYNKDAMVSYGGGGIYTYQSSAYIAGNIISYNATNSGGGGVYFSDSPVYFENNVVSNNYSDDSYFAGGGGGMMISGSDNAVIIGNIFCNNTSANAGGICCIKTSGALFVNNTIAYNYSSGNTGGLNLWEASPELYNNIFWGNDAASNGDQVTIIDNLSEPNFYNCNIQGGKAAFYTPGGVTYKGQMINCKNIDPAFATLPAGAGYLHSGLTASWKLKEGSPCINEGLDIVPSIKFSEVDAYKDKRVRFAKIDIGATEFYQKTKIVNCGNSTISSDTKWIADTIKVSCHVTINDNVTLSIYPGTVIQFQGHYKIQVNGTLLAIGNKTDSIRFTIANPTGHDDISNFNGGWLGIRFDNSSSGAAGVMKDNDTSHFEYCIFEYGKAKQEVLWDERFGGAMFAQEYSKIIISNCHFYRNISQESGGTIALYSHASPIIRANVFEDNICDNGAGVLHCEASSPLISGNLFYNNREGVMYLGTYSTPLIEKNTFINNGTYRSAIDVNQSSPVISNNIICNNESGIQISNFCTNPVFINNTIANNRTGFVMGSNSSAKFYNNIIWNNNSMEYYFWDNTCMVAFYNCNIQDGISGIPKSYVIDSVNVMNVNPGFISPTGGVGYSVNARNADWGLHSVSPMINAGTTSGIPAQVLQTDASGKPRINSVKIDLGALENQKGIPAIISQPQNKMVCEGNKVTFAVSTNDTVNYQWMLNGNDIPGAVSPAYIINNAGPVNQGNYMCQLTNSYGKVSSNNAMLSVNTKPYILSQPRSADLCVNEPLLVDAIVSGAIPMTFDWRKNGVTMNGAITSSYAVDKSKMSDAGFYKCIVTNTCGNTATDSVKITIHTLPKVTLGKDTSVCKTLTLDAGAYKTYQWQDFTNSRKCQATKSGDYYVKVTDDYNCSGVSDTIAINVAKPYADERICIVSVSDSLNRNRIVWVRTANKAISSYNIYKLIGPSYVLTGNVPFSQNSVFIDYTSLPENVSARYALSVIDSCGNESDKSPYHQTMLLGAAKGTLANQAILTWVKYEDESGSFVPDYYIIFKGKTKTSMTVLDSVSGMLPPMYIDNAFDGISSFYQIVIRKHSSCDPTALKAESGPYTQSLSNIIEYKTEKAGLYDNSLSALAYPNPFSEKISITISLEKQTDLIIEVINAVGAKDVVYEFSNQAAGTSIVDLSLPQLPSGVYFLKIIAGDKIQMVKCVKQ